MSFVASVPHGAVSALVPAVVNALPAPFSGTKPKRQYRYVGLDWSDPEMRRAYDRENQRRWRAKNRPNKRVKA